MNLDPNFLPGSFLATLPGGFLILIAAAYLIGSISTAIITCKLLGLQDPRTTGSNNPGATNVLRSGGKKAGAITLFGDMLKGLIPVLVARQLQADSTLLALTGCAAFLGHVFPVYYGFKGGKGVATFYGTVLGMHWISGLIALSIWGLSALIFKISSLAALTSILASPVIMWWFTQSTTLSISVFAMGIIIFWRHRTNIQKIMDGSEDKIGSKR